MEITPSQASIKVNETINLEIGFVNTGKDEDELEPLIKSNPKVTWSATAGTLTGTGDVSRTYKAPDKVPAQNPVAVSAEVNFMVKYHGKTFNKALLVSNINIGGDNYVLQIVDKRDPQQLGLWLTDSASMDVNIVNNGVVIANIKNFDPVASPTQVSASGCTFSYTENSPGDINITAASGELRIQSPTQWAIQFFFTHSGTHDPNMRQFCPLPAPLPPYDVSSIGASHKGKPLTLFFN